MQYRHLFALFLLILVTGCSTTSNDTLGSLKGKSIIIEKDAPVDANIDTAIETYEAIIREGGAANLNEKALRRLGDLEMQRIDRMFENNEGHLVDNNSYDKAISTYQKLLTSYPNYADRETIIYQLARAYEHNDRPDKSIKALKIFIRDYPNSVRNEEISFRLGELLFQEARYRESEIAYNNIISRGRNNNKYYEQALFKYAWSIYKQDRCVDSITPFLTMLDLKLTRNITPAKLEKMSFISRSDVELVNDSFRAINLCITTQKKPITLTDFLKGKPNRIYEFMMYSKLAELYLKQERETEAGQVYRSYFKRSDWHPYALIFHDKSIAIESRFKTTAETIEAKKEFVRRYNTLNDRLDKTHHNDYQRYLVKSDTESMFKIQSRLKVHLVDIAKYHHARAKKVDGSFDFQKAAKWYSAYLKNFPQSDDAAEMNFLLAETLFEDKLYTQAAREYERAAYEYGKHKNAAEAGYAALVAYTEQEKLLTGSNKKAWYKPALQSALTFSRVFYKDPRVPAVLAKAAHELYEGHNYDDAIRAAETILHRYPDSDTEIRRTALIVLANTQFETKNYEVAELFYMELRALLATDDPLESEVKERLAACIYKQAEHFRAHGAVSSAIEEFNRLIATVPDSSIRPIAEYDIATTYITMDMWQEAATKLEAFRDNYPDHDLARNIDEKLAVAYVRLKDPLKAADILRDIVKNSDSPESKRDALWQAAGLYEKAGHKHKAATTYNAYANMFPSPLEPAIEALHKAGLMHQQNERDYYYRVQLEKIYDADMNGGSQRTNRTRYLAAQAAFILAEPHFDRYEKIRLVEPIRKNMQLKNQLMKQALKAYNKAAQLGVAEYTTAATFRIADMYSDFSHKLMDSDRPANLDDEEMEQYELMLEEQAFPFEEQAIELHETNVNRMRDNGLFDQWITRSIKALAELMPARYLRIETHDIAATTAN